MQIGVFRRRAQEEAELDNSRDGCNASCLDGKADEPIDGAVAALECMRVLLRRRQLQDVQQHRSKIHRNVVRPSVGVPD